MTKRRKTVGFPQEANTSCKPPELNYDTSIPSEKVSRVNITNNPRKKTRRCDR